MTVRDVLWLALGLVTAALFIGVVAGVIAGFALGALLQ